eukprot:13622628-Alexandrium_andersonii.AAC.1
MRALWEVTTPPQPMAEIPEENALWQDLDVSAITEMSDWYKVVPPLWSIQVNHPMASTLPDRIETTVKIFEGLLQ